MQACRLRIGDTHPSQVLKVVAAHSAAAFLLADSSCLLFSLASPHSLPRSISSPCTDACFLRLRSRQPVTVTSPPSSSIAEHHQSDTKTPEAEVARRQVEKFTIVAEEKSMAQGLFFLTVSPGDQRSSTFLRAWLCLAPAFPQMAVHCERFSSMQDSTMVARLDIPHGLTIKIAASVNVFVVFSPSVGKVWIIAARVSRCQRATQDSGINGFLDHSNDAKRDVNSVKQSGLCLIKCAVIDCNAPVYCMHLSLQHLFLGQSGGLKIWPLRPLVGLAKRLKKNLDISREECFGNIEQGTEDDRYAKDSGELTNKDVPSIPLQRVTAHNLDPKALGCNGSISQSAGVELLNNLKAGLKFAVPIIETKVYGKSDDRVEREEDKVAYLGKTLFRNLGERGLEEAKHTTKQDGVEGVNAKPPSKHVLWPKESGYPARNGLLYLQASRFDGQDEFPCSSSFCQDATSSSSSLCLSASSLASLCSLSSAAVTASTSTFKISEDGHSLMNHCDISCKNNRTIGSFFVPFAGVQENTASKRAKSKHAISIQSLSERDFIVLDSDGKLYLLKLHQFPASQDGLREPKVNKFVVADFFLKPLNCHIGAKLMAVLPSTRQNGLPGLRKLWLSDGFHSIYILSLYQNQAGAEERNKDVEVDPEEVTVTEAVFMPERIHALAATSEYTVMVLTQGCITAYSMSES